ncbi:MAG: undecaprenyl-diphosphatase [Parcubacteria bacterium C7867-001]|nr:MAG: undecaprenyl-diphosphatase [Parcubacteria bacterium C7867-001]
MLNWFDALFLGGLQGLTELFPISSLGHSVLLPSLLGLSVDQHDESFIILLVATHLATAIVLVGFFWKEYWSMFLGFIRSVKMRRIPEGDRYAKIAWLLIVATVPAGFLGLLFQHDLKEFFASPVAVALFLFGNGILLYGAELLRKRHTDKAEYGDADQEIARLSFLKALGIGFMQALALFPGFSRTGASLAGGLLSGLTHSAATRFAFFLATPIIFAAAALKLPQLITEDGYPVEEILAASVISGFTAYIAVKFLTKYFKTNTLIPFSIYCIFAGLLSFIVLSL